MNPEDLTLLFICTREDELTTGTFSAKIEFANDHLYNKELKFGNLFFAVDKIENLNIKSGDKFAIILAKLE